jgi:neprosin-like protein
MVGQPPRTVVEASLAHRLLPPTNEDGNVSNTRRGSIAAGLAVAVVGSLGVVWTLSADADEVAAAPASVAEQADSDNPQEPPELPWGGKPGRLKVGRAGASSAQLAATGADSAAPTRARRSLRAGYSPKGYSSRRGTLPQSRTTVPPAPSQPLAADPVVPGKPRVVNYHYAGVFQYIVADGAAANLVISNPKLAEKDHHSLAEIAVESADGQQIVEVGWTVDRSLNGGSEDPHFFVYHWVNGDPACYNKCGYQINYDEETGAPPSMLPGDRLPINVSKRFGIRFYDGAWWIAYEKEYIGWFPAENWKRKGVDFTQSGLIQWFGEVAAASTTPCSQMGTGQPPTDEYGAARFGSMSLTNPKDSLSTGVWINSPGAEKPQYDAIKYGPTTARFGGAGASESAACN